MFHSASSPTMDALRVEELHEHKPCPCQHISEEKMKYLRSGRKSAPLQRESTCIRPAPRCVQRQLSLIESVSCGNSNSERASFSCLAQYFNAAAVGFDDGLRNRQAQSRSPMKRT